MKRIKLKKEELMGKTLEFTNSQGDLIEVCNFTGSYAVFLNDRCVKATKTLEPVQRKLNYLLNNGELF